MNEDKTKPNEEVVSGFSGRKLADELQPGLEQDSPTFTVPPERLPDAGVEGVEKIDVFDDEERKLLFGEIKTWFEAEKDNFPETGIAMYGSVNDPELMSQSPLELPESVQKLIEGILADATADSEKSDKIAKILLERTGSLHSSPEDMGYHVDTKQIYWDEDGNRVGYDPERGPDKYMVFIDRPGTYLVAGKVEPGLTHTEVIKNIASQLTIDEATGATMASTAERPQVYQLDSDEIYNVEVGNVLHAPPPHEDGLLVTVSFVDSMPASRPAAS